MSDKTLSEGCKYITDTYTRTVRFDDVISDDNLRVYSERYDDSYWIDEIIWHPLHIWDVLSYIESLPWSYWIGKWCHTYKTDKIIKLSEELLSIWEDKRNELAPTNEELVDYIYSLIA